MKKMRYIYLIFSCTIFVNMHSQNYILEAKANEQTYFSMLTNLDKAKKNIISYENSKGNFNYDFTYKSLSSFENDYQYWKKIKIASKNIYLLNIDPFSEDKNYFELYWKRALESFDFYDSFYLREYFGHSYRDRFDYSCSYFQLLIEQLNLELYLKNHPEDSDYSQKSNNDLENDKYNLKDLGVYSAIERSNLELIIENFAMITPLIIYLLIIFLIFKIQFVKNIINKYLFFESKKNTEFTKKIKKNFQLLFFIVGLFLIYDILDNLRLIPNWSGITEGFNTPNGILEKVAEDNSSYDDINNYAGIKDGWHFILLKYMIIIIISYSLSVLLAKSKWNIIKSS